MCGRYVWERKLCKCSSEPGAGSCSWLTCCGPIPTPWPYGSDVPCPMYSTLLFSGVTRAWGIWHFSQASEFPARVLCNACLGRGISWVSGSCLVPAALACLSYFPRAPFQTQTVSWRSCYYGIVLSTFSQTLMVLPGLRFAGSMWGCSSVCRRCSPSGATCCCQEALVSPSSFLAGMGWCGICYLLCFGSIITHRHLFISRLHKPGCMLVSHKSSMPSRATHSIFTHKTCKVSNFPTPSSFQWWLVIYVPL